MEKVAEGVELYACLEALYRCEDVGRLYAGVGVGCVFAREVLEERQRDGTV
jgi:hypothetical protein